MRRSLSIWAAIGAALLLAAALAWLLHATGEGGARGRAAPLAAPKAANGAPGFAAPAREAAPTDASAGIGATEGAVPDGRAGAAPADPALAAVAVLTGRITRAADGAPARDVPVTALVSSGGTRIPAPLDAVASRPLTDAEGRYRLVFTAACTLDQLRAGPGPDTVRGKRDTELALEPGTESTLDLALGSGGALAGRVVDGDGQPVPGATVTGWTDIATQAFENRYEPDRTVQADGAGEFVLEGLGPPFVIRAGAPGYAAREQLVGTLADGARIGAAAGGAPVDPPLTLVLSREREIRGVVLDPAGAAVPRAHVTIAFPADASVPEITAAPDVFRKLVNLPELRTDAAGRFVRTGCCSEVLAVSAFASGYVGARAQHAPGDGDLVLRLGSGATLTGTVTSATEGTPIAGAQLMLILPDKQHQQTRTQSEVTDEHGRFTFTGLSAAPNAELVVTAEGHAVRVLHPLVVRDTDNPSLDIALDPGLILAGRVVDADGAPVAGATVEVEGDRVVDFGGVMSPIPTWESRAGLQGTGTNAEGRFRLDQLYSGSFEVKATHPRNASLTAMLTAPSGREDLLLVLDASATSGVTLVGRATDALTGRPVTDFSVAPMLPAGNGGFIGESYDFEDEDGRWRITGLEPGPMQLSAQAQGCAPWSAPLTDYAAGEHHVDIRFTAARQVRLRVLDSRRAPVEAQLSFRDAQDRPLMVASGQGARKSLLRTDERGEALAAGLPAELLTVSVKRGWFSESQDFLLDLRPEPHGTVELVLGSRSTVRLTLLVLGASAGAAPPVDGDVASWAPALVTPLSLGELWPLEVDARITVLDAARAVRAEARLDLHAPADELAFTQQLAPGATRSALARLVVPAGEPLTVSVEADGYATHAQTLTADAETGSGAELLVLLRRP